ncbi:hypothetical protein BRADI_2g35578v3 [Brachypodium distachyon]|uniref:Uncharacterized protein n=1 Tax=Brachypodium distachyon TaxID=15368 RepID=A0A0Q3G7W2_BRADI|nr:hypothetical protein BRADI_2g35578v3 [Brachypodium distachyon]KQK07456.1 hypothetical protein BRADI_2g35578v3 [Brachypodium distachyon]KQK07457.1 hypothetical protein BRADI_2g35578v3 [Brachypodium distachyon]PNT71787.1 hypothetical protein BRADI_2g35578v3 [Brachypodium distachyon]PNT71788.1 hypothetical protein BRADI_2g35578v3 [Brachypodium distachyon]
MVGAVAAARVGRGSEAARERARRGRRETTGWAVPTGRVNGGGSPPSRSDLVRVHTGRNSSARRGRPPTSSPPQLIPGLPVNSSPLFHRPVRPSEHTVLQYYCRRGRRGGETEAKTAVQAVVRTSAGW